MISYDDFRKIEIRMGKVLSVEILEGSDKLYQLTVDFGEEKKRTILSGIREFVTISELEGALLPFVVNLEPRKIRGVLSEGMILAVKHGEGAILLKPEGEAAIGDEVI